MASILIDGNCEQTSTSYWTVISGSISKSTTNPHGGTYCLNQTTGSIYPHASNFISFPIEGYMYRMTGWARGDGSANPIFKAQTTGGASLTLWTGTTSTSWQYFDITFMRNSNLYTFYLTCNGAGSVDWDDLSLEFVRRNLVIDGNCEETNTAKWSTYITGTFTKETATPGTYGVRVLRITHDGVNNNPGVVQTILTPGRTYKLTGLARSDGTAQCIVGYEVRSGVNAFTTTSNSWQTINTVFTPDNYVATQFIIRMISSTPGQWIEVDDLEVKEVPTGFFRGVF